MNKEITTKLILAVLITFFIGLDVILLKHQIPAENNVKTSINTKN